MPQTVVPTGLQLGCKGGRKLASVGCPNRPATKLCGQPFFSITEIRPAILLLPRGREGAEIAELKTKAFTSPDFESATLSPPKNSDHHLR